MKAEYAIKVGDKWYRAGDELPGSTPSALADVPAKETVSEEKKYTKTSIMAMNVKALRKLAEENGIENADEYTGTELKEMLVEKLV